MKWVAWAIILVYTYKQMNEHTYILTYNSLFVYMHTYRQTDIQADRQTDSQTDSQTDRKTGRQTDRKTYFLVPMAVVFVLTPSRILQS